eukprot:CAMPEP_0198701806 /NCGR_PEP_ID=MMETSP1468-20131203/388397_1 /TAXON_ID=1461545 /ORGANISM="Mantoniella sp, Strain CCMP1436" /LENGTH=124 /DNA_ID=CAMNT_0044460245 /DNA_START=965 /DNA_END=1341 /DNA_ORIENTATION=-
MSVSLSPHPAPLPWRLASFSLFILPVLAKAAPSRAEVDAVPRGVRNRVAVCAAALLAAALDAALLLAPASAPLPADSQAHPASAAPAPPALPPPWRASAFSLSSLAITGVSRAELAVVAEGRGA